MKLIVKDLDFSSGGPLVVVLNYEDAVKMGVHTGDRIGLNRDGKHIHAIVNISESKRVVPKGRIGCFEEVLDALKVKNRSNINIEVEPKPSALKLIKKRMDGKKLTYKEIHKIIETMVEGRLSEAEIAFFVASGYMQEFSETETANLTKAMIDTGDVLKFPGIVVDKHCTGGVAGNRTTMVVIPIIVAAGLKMPKTSSRAITSPAGTADTMEVLAPVELSKEKVSTIVNKVGGCIVWGGSFNLAPSDDKIIKVEHSLSIDAEGQLLASILAKKGSVGSKIVLIDIPVGKETKIKTMAKANHLKRRFESLGKKLGMKVIVIVTSGNEPIGNGIGPALEAKDVLKVLQRSDSRPLDLEKKSLKMAGIILEAAGKCKTGMGVKKALEILESGKAMKKMEEIIRAQGGKVKHSSQVKIGKFSFDYKASKKGTLKDLNNDGIAQIAKIAGAPLDKGAGIYIHKHEGQKFEKGEILLTIHAENKKKLEFAKKAFMKVMPVRV